MSLASDKKKLDEVLEKQLEHASASPSDHERLLNFLIEQSSPILIKALHQIYLSTTPFLHLPDAAKVTQQIGDIEDLLTPEDPLYLEIRKDKLYFLMMASESESEISGSFPLTEFISSLTPVKDSKIIDKSIILNKIAPMRGGAKNAFRQIFLNLHLNKKIDRALLLKLAEILVHCIGTLAENKSMDTRLSLYIKMIHEINIDPEKPALKTKYPGVFNVLLPQKKPLDESPDPDTAARAAGSG